jgi:hypothetical protein
VYDRLSVTVVLTVVAMLAAAFLYVTQVMEPNPGTAPPVLEPAPITHQDAGEITPAEEAE